jgi:hypothetical protein
MVQIDLRRTFGFNVMRVWVKTGMFDYLCPPNQDDNDKELFYDSYVCGTPQFESNKMVFERIETAEFFAKYFEPKWPGAKFYVIPSIQVKNPSYKEV